MCFLNTILLKEGFDYEIRVNGINVTKKHEEADIPHFKMPAMLIQPLIENAIQHGIRPLSERRGKLVLAFTLDDDDSLMCEVIDNGNGYSTSPSQSSSQKKHSYGTDLVKNRIAIIHQLGYDKIALTIANNEPNGTIARITIY